VVEEGQQAPDFTLHATPDQAISLSQLRGRPVILAFYPADWSPVCGDQLALYNEVLDEFRRFDAELVGISVDGAWCHMAFAQARGLHFPLLADFEPKGAVSQQYGAYRFGSGFSERALFVLDARSVVAWSQVVEPEGAADLADAHGSSALQLFANFLHQLPGVGVDAAGVAHGDVHKDQIDPAPECRCLLPGDKRRRRKNQDEQAGEQTCVHVRT